MTRGSGGVVRGLGEVMRARPSVYNVLVCAYMLHLFPPKLGGNACTSEIVQAISAAVRV